MSYINCSNKKGGSKRGTSKKALIEKLKGLPKDAKIIGPDVVTPNTEDYDFNVFNFGEVADVAEKVMTFLGSKEGGAPNPILATLAMVMIVEKSLPVLEEQGYRDGAQNPFTLETLLDIVRQADE